jgi:hypothetical protein
MLQELGCKNNDVRAKLMGDLGTKVKVGILRKMKKIKLILQLRVLKSLFIL